MKPDAIFHLGELFEQVQIQKIFPDNKTFVDAVPKEDLSLIQERYEAQKNDDHFNLENFVHQYFTPPQQFTSSYESDINKACKCSHRRTLGYSYQETR